MTFRLVQISAGTAPGDAITREMALIADCLKSVDASGLLSSYAFYAENIARDCGIPVKRLASYTAGKKDIVLLHYSMAMKSLETLLSGTNPKILIYHNITPESYFLPYSLTLAGKLVKARRDLRQIRGRFDACLAVSAFNSADLFKLTGEKAEVLPLFFDTPSGSSAQGKSESIRLLNVGRIVPNKGHVDLIKILYYLKKLDPGAELIVAGRFPPELKNYRDEIEQLAAKLGLRESVQLTGFLDDQKLRDLYASSSVYVCASGHEGFCAPLLEAMYAGMPVVAYAGRTSAVAETMDGAGVLFYEMDHPLVAELIFEVARNSRMRESILVRQQERIGRIDFKRAASFLLEKIREVIDSK